MLTFWIIKILVRVHWLARVTVVIHFAIWRLFQSQSSPQLRRQIGRIYRRDMSYQAQIRVQTFACPICPQNGISPSRQNITFAQCLTSCSDIEGTVLRQLYTEPEIKVCKTQQTGPRQGQAKQVSKSSDKVLPTTYKPLFRALYLLAVSPHLR